MISPTPTRRPRTPTVRPTIRRTMSVPTAAPPARPAVRVGAVSYLNSRPLIEGLTDDLPPACSEVCEGAGCEVRCRRSGVLTLDLPSRLADGLRDRSLDVALVPSVFALANRGYRVLGDACVAARGPVRSVKAYFRTPPGEVRTLALDEGSRTSASLLRVMLSERFGVEPETRTLPLEASVGDVEADAVLMIGDRAMTDPRGDFAAVWDLGEHWRAWTGLPFVFAMWVARSGVECDAVEAATAAARDRGVAAIDAIAEREAAGLGLSVDDAAGYLRRNLHFTLGPAERAGLRLFAELLRRSGVVADAALPEGV